MTPHGGTQRKRPWWHKVELGGRQRRWRVPAAHANFKMLCRSSLFMELCLTGTLPSSHIDLLVCVLCM